MLLNSFAQPTLLTPQKSYLNFKEFQEAPVLLSHKNALNGKRLPVEWCGNIYGTPEILNEISKRNYGLKAKNLQPLTPNVVYKIKINHDEYQGKVKYIELILIHWDKEYAMYLIKADNVTNLLTDMITENMEVFVQNKILREHIKTGIDVLYINDGVYSNSTMLKEYPNECLLGALATLIKPRFVKGLLSEDQLPIYLEKCCADDIL